MSKEKETILSLIEIIEEQQELIKNLLGEYHTKDQAARGAMIASCRRIVKKTENLKRNLSLMFEQ